MVASNAREVLKKENELLEELAKRTSTFAQNLPALQADIINDWAAYFRGWQKINEDLIGKADSAIDDELKMEMKRLEGMRNSVTGDSASAKYWRQVLDEDIEIANETPLAGLPRVSQNLERLPLHAADRIGCLVASRQLA